MMTMSFKIVIIFLASISTTTAKLRGPGSDVVDAEDEKMRELKRMGRGMGMRFSSSDSSSDDDDDDDTLPLSSIRSIEGTENPLAGLEAELQRFSGDAHYPDGQGIGASMHTEPNARMLSNIVASIPDGIGQASVTDALWQWGQFVDHDIGFTEGKGEAYNIINPDDDTICEIPFNRAFYHFNPPLPMDGSNCDDCVREQLNEITGFLDASSVYGHTNDRAEFLREGQGGRMKMQGEHKLLPFSKDGGTGFANADNGDTSIADDMFIAGDPRVNEQIGLIAIHTLWVREHNRIAEILNDKYDENDENIYQMARKLVTAEINHITYTEFLPLLIGSYAPDPFDAEFDSDVNPGVAQEFAACAFRVGHSFLSEKSMIHNGAGATGYINLVDAFFSPGTVVEFPGIIDGILIGHTSKAAEKPDMFVVDAVRNNLFGAPVAKTGFDLVALNIQRARDHGIGRYNEVRMGYDLEPKSSFNDVSSNQLVRDRLELAYGNIDLCDAWVCGIAEDPVGGGLLGELFSTIIGDQFDRFMNGDSFFYTLDPDVSDEDFIKKTGIDVFSVTYSDIINANTIGGAEENAMVAPNPNIMRRSQ